jgi:RNA polymerase sigma-70 factor (ECF subfamily)
MSIKVITKRSESGLKTYTSIEKVPDQITRSALDQELLAKITKGDKHAFGILYQRYLNQIYNYIYFQVNGNKQEAEDLSEEVFLRTFQVVTEKTEKNKNFRALVFTIARNLVIDSYRANKNEVAIEHLDISSNEVWNPEQTLESSQLSKSLSDAIQNLRPNLQEIIILRYILELDTDEIAEIMGISNNYVRVLQYRALQSLKVTF